MRPIFRIVGVLFLFVCLSNQAFSQVSAYIFTQSTSTYTPITGGTNLTIGNNWDDEIQNVALPFSFTFNGTAYSAINISHNGFITFGATAPQTNNFTPISSSAGYAGAISGFGRDIINNGVPVAFATSGTAPNRSFTVQWTNCRRYSGGAIAGDVINFQITLVETSNAIVITYGTCTATSTTSLTCQVGLRGAANSAYNNRSSTTNWSTTTSGVSNAAAITSTNLIMPASGLTFTYTVPVACTGSPAAAVIPSTLSPCTGTTTVITASSFATGGGISYQWQESPNGTSSWVNVTGGAGATTTNYTTSAVNVTRYFRLQTTCSNSSQTTSSNVITVTPNSCSPANDICSNAIAITNFGTNVLANNSFAVTNGPEPSCGGTGIRDVWYSFVYNGGTVNITTSAVSGGLADTRIALYAACGGVQVGCNDDNPSGGLYSILSFNCNQLTVGQTYYIQAGGYNTNVGAFNLNVAVTNAAGCTNPFATNYNACAITDNGTCTFPPLSAAFSYVPSGTNCLNIQLSDESEGNLVSWQWTINGATPSSSTSQNPLVSFPGPGTYPVSVTVTDASGATASITQNVIVETGVIMTVDITADNLPQQTTWTVFDSNNNPVQSGTSADATFCINDECHRFEIYDSGTNGICCSNGNGSYRLYLNGIEVANGASFSAEDIRFVNCPQGTSCNDPIVITPGSFTAPERNTWYSFTPPVNGQYKVSTCGLAACDTRIWIYDYCNMANFDDSNEATLTYNDDFCGVQSEVTPIMEGGQTYYIRIGDSGNSCGTSSISFILEYLGPIVGCMDVLACNYSPIASAAGPCYYNGSPNCENLGPDLEVSLNDLFNSLSVQTLNGTDACLVNEGCIQGLGSRQILRFTTTIWNIGNQDYFIGQPNANNSQFEWDPCHNHYHYEGYAEYLLFDANGAPMPEIGFKNGFCVLDLFCPSGFTAKYTCGNMGITAGCRDTYSSALTCQWIDITNVPAGSYYLVVRTNWDQSPDNNGRYELRYDNNWAQVCISFQRDANGNVINFTKNIASCPIIEDCVGQPFGDNYPDCAGNCPGTVKKGDVIPDGLLNELDTHHYLDLGVDNAAMAVTTCNDLNADGILSVADAAYMEDCIHDQLDLGVLPMNIDECAWDPEIVDQGESVTLGIHQVNLTDGYVDLYINNPLSEISALEFQLSGIAIESVENLLPTDWTPHVHWQNNGYRIAATGAGHSTMAVHFSDTPFMRVHYSTIESNQVCITEITDVMNAFIHNVLTQIGACGSLASVSAALSSSTQQVCSGSSVQFNDISTGGVTSRTWTFEGGSPASSTSANPSVVYANAGSYDVSLTVSNGSASNTITLTDYITVAAANTYYFDGDGDGYGVSSNSIQGCVAPSNYVLLSGDCDDNAANYYPGASEVCNNVDDDCDASIDEGFDNDGDGFTTCEGDCNDNSAIVYPGAMEICNGADEDCDTLLDETFDADGDGVTVCNGDCDDSNASIYPGAVEICGNNIDEDCTGGLNNGCPLYTFYMDADGDGFGTASTTMTSYVNTAPPGYSTLATDCNDTNGTIHPNASEVCGNLTDDDCDGFINEGCTTSVVANDNKSNATVVVGTNYPSCSNVFGNLTNATASPEAMTNEPVGAGQDVWYQVIAQTNALRISGTSTINNLALEVQDQQGNLIASSDFGGVSTQEILVASGLTPGQNYFVAVRNFNTAAVGNFTLCIQHLEASSPDYGLNYSGLCSTFKCNWTGASLYEVTIMVNGQPVSYTGSSTLMPFNLFPGLSYGQTYPLYINSIFNLTSAGQTSTVIVPAGPFMISFAPAADLDLRNLDRCPTQRTMGAFISADLSLCQFSSYEWEFVQVNSEDEVVGLQPVYWDSGTRTRFMRVSNIPGVQPGHIYRVRIRPHFGSTPGDWGTDYQLLCVASSAGMTEPNEPNANLSENWSALSIYPNPSNGEYVNYSLEGIDEQMVQVRVIDLNGRVVYTKQLNTKDAYIARLEFDRPLASGVYTIELSFGEERIVEKLLVGK